MHLPRRSVNLFYWNIFRLERYAQHLIGYPLLNFVLKFINLIGLTDNINKRGKAKSASYDFEEYMRTTLGDERGNMSRLNAGRYITILVMLLVFSLLNVIGGTWKLGMTFWSYGAAILGFIGLLITNYYLAPTDRSKYLKDFREFEKRTPKQKRTAAIISIFLVIGILSMFILSSWFYFRSFRK